MHFKLNKVSVGKVSCVPYGLFTSVSLTINKINRGHCVKTTSQNVNRTDLVVLRCALFQRNHDCVHARRRLHDRVLSCHDHGCVMTASSALLLCVYMLQACVSCCVNVYTVLLKHGASHTSNRHKQGP